MLKTVSRQDLALREVARRTMNYYPSDFTENLYFRPDAVPLVDAFDFHDEFLATAIGTYDGHAYERLLLAAQDSELNEADVRNLYR